MSQSRKMSAVEAIASTFIGLGVAYATQMLVFPLFGIHVPHTHNTRRHGGNIYPRFNRTRFRRATAFQLDWKMTPDELQQQEELGRKIAAALAPLGLSPNEIQVAAYYSDMLIADLVPTTGLRKRAVESKSRGCSRAAGVAAYFEEQRK